MKILLGVCGGIAAYKAAEITRALQDHGAAVEVALTRAAGRFVTPLTFSALTGKPVYTTLWSPDQSQHPAGPIDHIAVAQSIDALLVAPATATTLARLAHGLANDFLSAVHLATKAPLILAPAMNVNMWQHPATQANLKTLLERGAHLVEPDAGYLACGMTGSGRLASIDRIVERTLAAANPKPQDLLNETILITAGGTREAIDPVRFLGNRSSGRMGHALAAAALARGAKVILVTASSLDAPSACQTLRVENAAAMEHAIDQHLPRATVLIAAAAVADFRPLFPSATKIRRNGPLALTLEPTPDLVANAVARRSPGTLIIAFAAETENLEGNARAKLLRKGADAIVANDVSQPGIGFDASQNAGLFITRQRTIQLLQAPKPVVADRILDQLITLRSEPERYDEDLREAVGTTYATSSSAAG